MQEQDNQEALQEDVFWVTSQLSGIIQAILWMVMGIIMTPANQLNMFSALFLMGFATLASRAVLRRYNVWLAYGLLIGSYIVAVDILLVMPGAIDSFYPYLFLLAVALSSGLLVPSTPYIVVAACATTSLFTIGIFWGFKPDILYVWAHVMFLSSLLALILSFYTSHFIHLQNWTTTIGQRRLKRRNELFDNEQKLKKVNQSLETSNYRLAEAQSALSKANDELESRVLARTAELQDSENRYRSLFERSEANLVKTEALYKVTRMLSVSTNLQEVLQSIVDGVVLALPAQASSLIIFDFDKEKVIHYVNGGTIRYSKEIISFNTIEYIIPYEELMDGLTGWVIQHKKPVLSLKGESDHESKQVQKRRKNNRTGAIIVVPVQDQDHLLGTLTASQFVDQPDFTNDDVELMSAMADQSAVAIARATSQHERLKLATIQQELNIAQDIQQNLLPPPVPDWPDIEVICYNIPARKVGGDFYSYHRYPVTSSTTGDTERYGIAVGDISGKGISAALLMAASISQLDASFAQTYTPTPAERLVYLDKRLTPYAKPRRQNCAMCYVELIMPQRSLQIVNAGCIPPYIRRANAPDEWPDIGGFALGQGLGSELGYQQISRQLSQGDLVILTSDGVVEANNPNNEMLGFDYLAKIMSDGPTDSAKTMLAYLEAELSAFVQMAEPHDDVTIVVIRI
ncbi:SpoIIE family protein phosphatase [Anaerolineales bacterium HSG24]|nr:SpoIIE family protein phosphatase [Anaerolineales bacterium HSG24]